jgi:hypothetical protein
MQARIEYAIVALGLSKEEFAMIAKDAAGVTIDPDDEPAKFLPTLKQSDLEAIWKRLSEDPRWNHPARSP